MKIYLDSDKNIKQVVPEIPFYQSANNTNSIKIYCDFNWNSYVPTITFKRSDSVILGPFACTPRNDYIYFEVPSIVLAVEGELQFTIRFESFVFSEGQTIKTYSEVIALVSANVSKAVGAPEDSLENFMFYKFIELKERVENTSFITTSAEEPDGELSAEGSLWFQITNNDE